MEFSYQPSYLSLYLGLGSNLGKSILYLKNAKKRLCSLPFLILVKESKIYWTEPQEKLNQPWFANQVLKFYVPAHVEPKNLLKFTSKIEQEMGRVRKERYGPRTIDIDILIYGNKILNDSKLFLPHPKITKRAFVLIPLQEIEPNIKLFDQPAVFYLNQLDYKLLGKKIWQKNY
ncbi:2-amino-4-hydroxy-6-hydroxymethyldihydropteridine diphosphokinase [Desulfonauticus submarinus]